MFPPPGLIEDLPLPLVMYRHGILDVNTVMFYTLIWVVIHAVLQQYIWEVRAQAHIHTHTQYLELVFENPNSNYSPPFPSLSLPSAQSAN